MLHTYYRGCWHVFSRSFLVRYRQHLPADRALHTEILLHSRGVAASGFPHCAIFPTAASRRSLDRVSVPIVAVHPLRPATDRRLGGPLPRQPANQTRAHPVPPEFFTPEDSLPVRLCGISSHFWLLSPCTGQVTHALLTRPPLSHQKVTRRILKALRSTCMC